MKISAWPVSRTALAVLVMTITLVSSEAIAAFQSAPYFPLPTSASWNYNVLDETLTLEGTATVTRNATTTINSVSTIRLDTASTIPAPMNGSRSYNTSDGNGIRLHRKYTPGVIINGNPQNVTITFSPPIVLADGTINSTPQTASVTSGTATLEISIVTCPLSYTEPQVFTVNGFESVTVPAGTFNALKISGSIRITGFCQSSTVDQTLVSTLYLAEGIGPVKIVSTTTDNIALTTDTSTNELTSTNVRSLTVTKEGAGTGTVISSPAGINCGTDCSESYTSGTTVTLTATPTGGSTFAGWGGDCLSFGTASTCNLTMNSAKTATATFDLLPSYLLDVTVTGTGSVTSSPSGINCPGTCAGNFGGSVVLTANTASGSTFTGWGMACAGTGTTCNLTMDSAKTVSATFTVPPPPPSYTVTVNKLGTGSGTVTSGPAGIDCGSTCSASFNTGSGVILTATATGGSSFAGWSGDCTGSVPTCNLTMNSAKTAWATFTPPLPSHALTVNKLGGGSGTVTSGPAGIDCGGDCTENYTSGTSVTLTATPTDGATFGGWGGDCLFSGPAVTCTLTMGGARTASATFNAPPPPGSYTLTVTKAGTGTVTSSPAGIDCGGTCSAPLANGIGVTLTAAPTDGATFGGWGGDCAAFGTAAACSLTMTAAKTASATFNAPPPSSYPLTVTKGGSGSGSVTSSPAGIDCGGDCGESYASSTPVTLTATVTDDSTFDGWGGDCAGFATDVNCTVIMDSAKTASATFTAPPAPTTPTVTRTFLTTDAIVVEHIYYDPNDACLGVSPFTLKFFVFSMDGQLILGRNRDTTGGVTNTQIGASKYQTLVATLDPGTLPPGGYNVIFRVEDCTATAVYVSEFYTIEVFAAP